jgi:hypothetical protein
MIHSSYRLDFALDLFRSRNILCYHRRFATLDRSSIDIRSVVCIFSLCNRAIHLLHCCFSLLDKKERVSQSNDDNIGRNGLAQFNNERQ